MPGMREDYILFNLPLTRGLAYELYFRNIDRHETAWRAEKTVSIDDEIQRAKEAVKNASQSEV